MRLVWILIFCVSLVLPAFAADVTAASKTVVGQRAPETTNSIAAVPLDKPNMDAAAVLSWAEQSASEVMTFDYTNYQKALQHSSRRFTKAGWEAFAAAIQRSRMINVVSETHQTVTAHPQAHAVLLNKGAVDGRYSWIVSVPLTVEYSDGKSRRQDLLRLKLVIQRVTDVANSDGIGIADWKAQ